MEPLPYEIIEAMVQCFGRSFHYKDAVAAFFSSAGVPRALVDKHREQAKYVWTRKLLTELGETPDGSVLQRRVLTHLCQLRGLPDESTPDPDAGLDALRKLKKLALDRQLVAIEKKEQTDQRGALQAQREHEAQDRAAKLKDVLDRFMAGVTTGDRQGAGYSLEDILKDLFALFEIEYRKSYKTETQQIDGHFRFEGFDYLVEARWRKGWPTDGDIGGFKRKVDTKLESTRGMFVSVMGFREEVVDAYSKQHGANIIFMDGADLTFILEGRMDLRDALRLKVEKAAQEGVVFVRLGR